MRQIDRGVLEQMAREDPWFVSENGLLLMTLANLNAQESSQKGIELGEIDSVDPRYKESAGLHCFLGQLYRALTEELSPESKLTIERLKLQRTGEEDLLYFRRKSREEMQTDGDAAHKYIASHNISLYLLLNNFARAHLHFDRSLQLSERNPVVFRELVEPVVGLYMLSFLCDSTPDYTDGAHVLVPIVQKNYQDAKRRLGLPSPIHERS